MLIEATPEFRIYKLTPQPGEQVAAIFKRVIPSEVEEPGRVLRG